MTRPLPTATLTMDPETWGLWHEHICCDCGTVYACDAAHGRPLRPQSRTRCEPCAEKRLFGAPRA